MIPLLLALAQAGPPAPAATRRDAVTLRWEPERKACLASVHGVDTGDVWDEAGSAALVAALPDKGAALQLRGGADVPYDCSIAVVDALRHAGYYGRIGTITEPLPPGR